MEIRKFIERKKATALLLAGIGSFAFAGCHSQAPETDTAEAATAESEHAKEIAEGKELHTQLGEQFSKQILYYSNGDREIVYFRNESAHQFELPSIRQTCDGVDLLDISSSNERGTGGDTSRTPNHPACTDGRLTESDFQIEQ